MTNTALEKFRKAQDRENLYQLIFKLNEIDTLIVQAQDITAKLEKAIEPEVAQSTRNMLVSLKLHNARVDFGWLVESISDLIARREEAFDQARN